MKEKYPLGPGRADEHLSWPARWSAGWSRFWFAPRDPAGLHAVRVLSGLLFLFWLLPLAGAAEALCGLRGWFDLEAFLESSRITGQAASGWSCLYLFGENSTLFLAGYWASILVVALFT